MIKRTNSSFTATLNQLNLYRCHSPLTTSCYRLLTQRYHKFDSIPYFMIYVTLKGLHKRKFQIDSEENPPLSDYNENSSSLMTEKTYRLLRQKERKITIAFTSPFRRKWKLITSFFISSRKNKRLRYQEEHKMTIKSSPNANSPSTSAKSDNFFKTQEINQFITADAK